MDKKQKMNDSLTKNEQPVANPESHGFLKCLGRTAGVTLASILALTAGKMAYQEFSPNDPPKCVNAEKLKYDLDDSGKIVISGVDDSITDELSDSFRGEFAVTNKDLGEFIGKKLSVHKSKTNGKTIVFNDIKMDYSAFAHLAEKADDDLIGRMGSSEKDLAKLLSYAAKDAPKMEELNPNSLEYEYASKITKFNPDKLMSFKGKVLSNEVVIRKIGIQKDTMRVYTIVDPNTGHMIFPHVKDSRMNPLKVGDSVEMVCKKRDYGPVSYDYITEQGGIISPDHQSFMDWLTKSINLSPELIGHYKL